MLQTLDIGECIEFIKTRTDGGRKVLVFTTMRSHTLKYENIIAELAAAGKRVGLEIVDEYHNIISASSERAEQERVRDYLKDNVSRADSTIFYSASNKSGQLLSSFDESLFGPLLAKVTYNNLRERAYVAPRLRVCAIRVQPKPVSAADARESADIGLDLEAAQSEAVGIVAAYKDAEKFYAEPNLLVFGDHVEGCRHIARDKEMQVHLPDVKQHFAAAETPNDERARIFEEMRNTGRNILNQHSIAKEGINIPNLHSIVLGRDLNVTGIQQVIGRSGRANPDDTRDFEAGKLSLQSEVGWRKYRNLIYVLVYGDDETAYRRLLEMVQFLESVLGIPQQEWDVAAIEIAGGGAEVKRGGFSGDVVFGRDINFDPVEFRRMLDKARLEVEADETDVKIASSTGDDIVNYLKSL